jgi:hypothetical protein
MWITLCCLRIWALRRGGWGWIVDCLPVSECTRFPGESPLHRRGEMTIFFAPMLTVNLLYSELIQAGNHAGYEMLSQQTLFPKPFELQKQVLGVAT